MFAINVEKANLTKNDDLAEKMAPSTRLPKINVILLSYGLRKHLTTVALTKFNLIPMMPLGLIDSPDR